MEKKTSQFKTEKVGFWKLILQFEWPKANSADTFFILVVVLMLSGLLAIQVLWKPLASRGYEEEQVSNDVFSFYDEIESSQGLIGLTISTQSTQIGTYQYRVRVGVYQEAGANQEVERLKDVHDFIVESKKVGDRLYYAVYSKWFNSRRQGNFFRDQMINLGLDTFLERRKREDAESGSTQ